MTLSSPRLTAVPAFARWSRRPHLIVTYVLVPLLLGWFAFVVVDGAVELRSTEVRMPTPDVYDSYLDDFTVFYSASSLIQDGDGGKLYQLDVIHAAEAKSLGTFRGSILVLPFFTPPFVIPVLAPLALLRLPAAAALWTVGGFTALAGCALALLRQRGSSLTPTLALGWGLAVVSSAPFFQTVLHGQTTFFLIAGWTLLWAGRFRGRSDWLTAAGLLLIAHKPQLVILPVAFLLLSGHWRPVLKAALVVCALTALAVGMTGLRIVPDHVRLLLSAGTWDDKNGISTWGMFGWNAFSRGLLSEAQVARVLLTAVLDLGTVALVIASLRRRRQLLPPEAVFGVLIFASLLLSPHVYEHDVLIAALPAFLLATSGTPAMRELWTAYALTGWFVLYFHFDILTATSINVSTLWLAVGLTLAAYGSSLRHPWLARPSIRRLRPTAYREKAGVP